MKEIILHGYDAAIIDEVYENLKIDSEQLFIYT